MVSNRAQALYEYLLMQREFLTDEFISKEQIQKELEYYYMKKDDIPDHYQSCYSAIRKDIRELRNASEREIPYVIVSSKKGYKLTTKEEYDAYSNRNWIRIKRMIITQANQDKKAKLNNQVNLFTKEEITSFIGG